MVFNLNLHRKKSEAREIPNDANDRHLNMLKAISPYAKASVQKNVTDVSIDYATRKTKLVLVLLPEWAATFPPFNLARLSAVAKEAGYRSTILDINSKCFKEWKYKIAIESSASFSLWNSASSWRWVGENYYTFVHP